MSNSDSSAQNVRFNLDSQQLEFAIGLDWTAVPSGGGTPGSPDTSVQFNDAGSFAGSAALTWDGTNLAVDGNVVTQTVKTAAGNITIQSTSNGDSVILDAPANGTVIIQTNAGTHQTFFNADGTVGLGAAIMGPAGAFDEVDTQTVKGSTAVTLQVGADLGIQADNSSTAGQTRLLLFDVDAGTLVRVSVGAADSGGAGFKLLRVPN